MNLVVKTAALPPALGDTSLALGDSGDGAEEAILMQVLPVRRAIDMTCAIAGTRLPALTTRGLA